MRAAQMLGSTSPGLNLRVCLHRHRRQGQLRQAAAGPGGHWRRGLEGRPRWRTLPAWRLPAAAARPAAAGPAATAAAATEAEEPIRIPQGEYSPEHSMLATSQGPSHMLQAVRFMVQKACKLWSMWQNQAPWCTATHMLCLVGLPPAGSSSCKSLAQTLNSGHHGGRHGTPTGVLRWLRRPCLQYQQCFMDEETGDVLVMFHKTAIVRVGCQTCRDGLAACG